MHGEMSDRDTFNSHVHRQEHTPTLAHLYTRTYTYIQGTHMHTPHKHAHRHRHTSIQTEPYVETQKEKCR
jgi:hypothetical protein